MPLFQGAAPPREPRPEPQDSCSPATVRCSVGIKGQHSLWLSIPLETYWVGKPSWLVLEEPRTEGQSSRSHLGHPRLPGGTDACCCVRAAGTPRNEQASVSLQSEAVQSFVHFLPFVLLDVILLSGE